MLLKIAPLLLLPLALLAAAAYDERPPPGHTGGFGEPTCAACHFDNPLDDSSGDLRLIDLPERYEPGTTYDLAVVLKRPGLRRAGFQLAARSSSDGGHAGFIASADERAEVTEAAGVAYFHHTREGTEPEAEDSIVWHLRWTAPAEHVHVLFHSSATPRTATLPSWGDFVFTRSHGTVPR